MKTVIVEFVGPSFSGKTGLLACLVDHILHNRTKNRVDHDVSEGLKEQISGLVSRHRDFERTPPEGESASFAWQDWVLELRGHPGSYQPSPAETVEHFDENHTRLFVAVLNPFLCGKERSRLAFLDLIGAIQDDHGSPLSEACSMAANLLFHETFAEHATPGSELQTLIADNDKAVLRGHKRLRNGEIEPHFAVEGSRHPGEGERIVRLLGEMAERISRGAEHDEFIASLRIVLPQLTRCVVILSHCDLLRYMRFFGVEHCHQILDGLFGSRDRFVSQQILGKNVKVRVEKEKNTSTLVRSVTDFNTSGRQLFESIEKNLVGMVDGRGAEQDRISWRGMLKEALHHVLFSLPVACLIAIVLSFGLMNRWATEPFELFGRIFWPLLGSLSAVVTLTTWIRHQYGRSSWIIDRSTLGPTVVLRDLNGRTYSAPLERLRLRWSWVGRKLNVGSATLGDNSARRFLVPGLQGLRGNLEEIETKRVRRYHWWKDIAVGASVIGGLLLGLVAIFGTMPAPYDRIALGVLACLSLAALVTPGFSDEPADQSNLGLYAYRVENAKGSIRRTKPSELQVTPEPENKHPGSNGTPAAEPVAAVETNGTPIRRAEDRHRIESNRQSRRR